LGNKGLMELIDEILGSSCSIGNYLSEGSIFLLQISARYLMQTNLMRLDKLNN